MKYFINLSVLRRNPNFALLFTGQFVSLMGTMITGVALPYQIYMQTHSTLMVGLLSLVQLLPLLFTALMGGVFADRYHRRLLLLISEFILALGSILLMINASLATPHLWVLFVVASIMSAFTGLHRPALDSLLQQIVPKQDLPAVSSIATLKGSVCMVAGPAIGGVLIASSGLVVTYGVDVASFIISLIALCFITNIPKPTASKDVSTLAALQEGLRYAISRQELIGTYIVDFMAMIFGMPTALFPAIALSFGGPKALGLLYASPAMGAVVISFWSGWAAQVKQHGKAIALAALCWGIAIILFGLSHNMMLSIFFLAIAGAFDAISGIFRVTMWNETIPNHLRGRMSGIEMISYLSGPRLGDTEAGLVAAAFGITASIVSGGVLCIASVAISCYFLPKFWHYHSDN